VFVVALLCAGHGWLGCGGNSPSSPTSSQSQTDEFIGITRSMDLGCGTQGHGFTAANGPISVSLVQTNPATSLWVDMCPPTAAGAVPVVANCTFFHRQIDVGQTLEATRKGGAEQVVWFWPLTCGTGPPSRDSFSFRAKVTYLK
jgi:hypothetical protein